MKPLEQTQREFFSALMMPLRGTSREATDLSASEEGHSAEFLAIADSLMKPGEKLSSAEKMELYHRQYWFRVLESVAEDFPILRKMAGEKTFWAIIEAYLHAHPSSSFTLRHLGSKVPDFLETCTGLDVEKRLWFSSLARIEYTCMLTFEASSQDPVNPAELQAGEITLQPHVFLLSLPVPADLCADWETFQPGEPVETHLAIWRGTDGWHQQSRLHPTEHELLLRLSKGGTLAGIFAEPTHPEPTPEQVSEWFANWQTRSWIIPQFVTGESPRPLKSDMNIIDFSGVDKMGSQAMPMED